MFWCNMHHHPDDGDGACCTEMQFSNFHIYSKMYLNIYNYENTFNNSYWINL